MHNHPGWKLTFMCNFIKTSLLHLLLDVAHQPLVTDLTLHYDRLSSGLYIGGSTWALAVEEVFD